MKACPFCAELIQERAVKCRFCGEWLDPSARPSWSTDAPAPTAAPVAARPQAPERTESLAQPTDPSPATTATDGSTTRPLRSWSTPPWLAEREGSTPVANVAAPTPSPSPTPIGMAASGEIASSGTAIAAPMSTSGGTVVSAAARERVHVHVPEPRVAPEPAPAPRPAPPTIAAPAPALAPRAAAPAPAPAPPERASLEEVALQMERLGHGAAAMRGAVERGPEPRPEWDEPAFPSHPRPAPVVHDVDDDDLDGLAPPRGLDPARPLHDFDARYEDALPPRREATGVEDAFLGDLDADDDGGHDDWGDADAGFSGMAPAARPLPWVPILAGAALLVVVGAFTFRDALFGAAPADDTAVAESGEGQGEGEGGGDAKAEVGDAKAEVGDAKAEGGDANAEGGDAKAEGGDAKAEGGELGTPTPPQPAKLDAATLARLDEARGLYTKAEGRNTKLLKEAGAILDEVLKVAPEHPEALLLKAQVLLESGDMQDALAIAQRCTAASAELADCWLTIGVVQQENKEKDAALQAYERYLALAPEGKYARDVSRQVKKLKR